jgi:hypothetical protein
MIRGRTGARSLRSSWHRALHGRLKMFRIVPPLALVAALNVAPVSSQSSELDMRCTSADRVLAERLRGLLPRQPGAATAEINLVMARMASARFDCKHGRAERGLRTYADAETVLEALEEVTAAKLAPTSTASGEVAAQ